MTLCYLCFIVVPAHYTKLHGRHSSSFSTNCLQKINMKNHLISYQQISINIYFQQIFCKQLLLSSTLIALLSSTSLTILEKVCREISLFCSNGQDLSSKCQGNSLFVKL